MQKVFVVSCLISLANVDSPQDSGTLNGGILYLMFGCFKEGFPYIGSKVAFVSTNQQPTPPPAGRNKALLRLMKTHWFPLIRPYKTQFHFGGYLWGIGWPAIKYNFS